MSSNYELLALCIHSGQVPEEDVIALMRQDEVFALWYKNKYLDMKEG